MNCVIFTIWFVPIVAANFLMALYLLNVTQEGYSKLGTMSDNVSHLLQLNECVDEYTRIDDSLAEKVQTAAKM